MRGRSRVRLNKRGKIAVLILLAVVIAIVFVFTYNREKEDKAHEIMETQNYSLKIDYPDLQNKEVAKEMIAYIDEKKAEFLEIAENISDVTMKYDFSVTYDYANVKDINIVHILVYSYTGG
ncbi:MAG: hypothetical protein K2J20_04540, partial [Bacilli bacterium]|nr:hypothetical protein [Bacilli bacterium]